MLKADITLCLIVKDEARFICSCIESVLPLVKEIRIADTGSSDDTIALCRRYTGHVEQISFSEGFSAARNHLLRKVQTEWVLFLDADEYFDATQLALLQRLLPDLGAAGAVSFLRYNFFPSGAFYTSDTIKLFRSAADIYYEGIVVDSIKPSLQRGGYVISQAPILLNHFGHCRPLAERDRKAHKYLAMMDEELTRQPDNFRVMGYKALVLRTVGQFAEAYRWAQQAVSAAPHQGHPYFVLGHVERAYGRHGQAVQAYDEAIARDGVSPLYLNSRGVAYLSGGLLPNAEDDFKEGMRRYPHHIHFKINLGLVAQAQGRYEIAAAAFAEVGRHYPAFLKGSFDGCSEVDPYSGFIYDTIYNYRGLSYHWAYCAAKAQGLL